MTKIKEAISLESDLLLKLKPLSEAEIFEFMKNLRGGTYFNMGMYSSIPISRAYKKTIRIYKVIDLTAIVSGVSYENIGTTKDFRQRTGEGPGKSWYDHTPGYENKIAQKKSDPNSKYVLWDIKRGTGTCVRYYVVDIDTGAVTPVSKEDVLQSDYLTPSEKKNLTPKPVEGFDKTTGELVENKTNWRTAAFDHIFWLSQAGKATQEYGTRFEEAFDLEEATNSDLFMDAHAHVRTDLDAILSGEVVESVKKPLEETTDADIFLDAHAGVKTKLNDVLSGKVTEELKQVELYGDEYYEYSPTLYLSGKNGKHKVRIYSYKKPDSDDEYDISVDIANENISVNETKLARELGYQRSHPYLSAFYFDELESVCKDIYNYFNDIPQDEIYSVLVDSLGCSETDVAKYFTKYVKEAASAKNTVKGITESYRRVVSRGNTLVDNELFVDFD